MTGDRVPSRSTGSKTTKRELIKRESTNRPDTKSSASIDRPAGERARKRRYEREPRDDDATRCKSNINRAISADCALIGFAFFPRLVCRCRYRLAIRGRHRKAFEAMTHANRHSLVPSSVTGLFLFAAPLISDYRELLVSPAAQTLAIGTTTIAERKDVFKEEDSITGC